MTPNESSDSDVYLTAAAVRKRYGGRSEMALYRWVRDPKLGFPAPLYIHRYRYWRLADLLAFERTRSPDNAQTKGDANAA